MTERQLRDPAAHDTDWQALAELIDANRSPEVTEVDVARLRRNVRSKIGRPRTRQRWTSRLAAAAACAALAAAGLTGLDFPDRSTDLGSAEFTLVRGEDGALVFEFSDGERVHRIARSLSPRPDAKPMDVRLTTGSRVAERNGNPAPGTAVFYRID